MRLAPKFMIGRQGCATRLGRRHSQRLFVSAVLAQQFGYVRVAFLYRHVQRCRAPIVLGIDVGTFG